MLEFLTAPGNLPFSVALAVMLMLLMVEIFGLFTGLGASDFLDGLLPEFGDADGAEVASASMQHASTSMLRMPQLCTASTRNSTPALRHARPSAASSLRKPGVNVTEATVSRRVRSSIASIIAWVSIAPWRAARVRISTPRRLSSSHR